MKEFRNWFRNMTAMLLCLALLAGICCVPALSETPAASATDLTEVEEPAPQPDQPEAGEEPAPQPGTEEPQLPETNEDYSQTETIDGVRITISADAGVFPAGTALTVTTADDADFARAAEAAMGTASGSEIIFRHAQYRFSCDAMNGAARISLEHLALSALQAQYPDADFCVVVLRYNPAGPSAEPVSASADISRNTVAFTLAEPGLYDILAVIQPAPETPEEPADPAPENQPEPEPEAEPEQPAAPSETEDLPAETAPAAETPEELSTISAPSDEEPGVLPAEDPLPTDGVSAFVTRCYRLILGREPDAAGISYWANLLRSRQKSAAEVISGFLGSTEFSRMRKSPEELVDILYLAMLDRQSEPTGKKYWLSLVMDGSSVAELVNGFCGSTEFKNICAGFGIESGSVPEKGSDAPSVYTPGMIHFVTRCYRIALDREPDDAGLAYWCKQVMSKKSTYKDVAEGFMFSTEMNNKRLSNDAFVRKLYLLYLDREAEPAGLQFWVNELNNGMTRKEANKGFAASMEFKTLMASYELESTHLIIAGDTSLTIKNGGKTQLQISPDLIPAGENDLVWTSSDEKIITVSQDGNLFGVYPGQARLTVTLPSGQTVADLVVTVQANYRALLFSESTYGKEGTFYRNRGDVRVMKNALSTVTGPDGGEYVIHTFDNLTADEIYDKITDYLIAPSRDGDVSMFFMASHGDFRASDPVYAGRLRCKDRETNVLLPVLAEKLTHVEGKVIVILQACGPGAAVHEWEIEDEETEVNTASRPEHEQDEAAVYEQGMSRAIISAFSAADPGLQAYQSEVLEDGYTLSQSSGTIKSKFLTSKFIVMTASDYMQMSFFMQANTNNIYPYWMSEGIGTSGPMPADVYYGNNNGELTVSELHRYVYDKVKDKQTPRVWPEDSSYVLFKRAP